MSNKSVVGALLTIAALSLTPSASAQTGGTQTAPQPPAPTATTETRPATTTTSGDTGLWFVPTGEILPARKWSFSVYRVNFDYTQGFTDVSDFPVTFGVGLADRAEIFGSWSLVRRIDRDVRPLFFPTADAANGGVVNQYPFVNTRMDGQPARRSLARRQGQHHVGAHAEAARLRGPRHGEAADGEHG